MDAEDALLSFAVEPHGFGAILQLNGKPTSDQQALLAKMHAMTQQPLQSFSGVEFPSSDVGRNCPEEGRLASTRGNDEDTCGNIPVSRERHRDRGPHDVGIDVQYLWESSSPRRYHDHMMNIPAFWMDSTPVTNGQFKHFLDAAHYKPADTLKFLRDWQNGTFPSGWENKPVTWVSLEDARAYAAWAGKRFPHEWEWQYAAQGTDDRRYSWGKTWDAAAVPALLKARTMTSPDPVGTHTKGASPFGVQDMTGTIWQWTDEFQDDQTRAAILRGGSYYQPVGSIWYFPQTYRNDEHGKFLLMSPTEDRSGGIGFRCVMDAQ